jgi:hypothetical protein
LALEPWSFPHSINQWAVAGRIRTGTSEAARVGRYGGVYAR